MEILTFEDVISTLDNKDYTYLVQINKYTKASTICVDSTCGCLVYKFNSTYDGNMRLVSAEYINNSLSTIAKSAFTHRMFGGFYGHVYIHYGTRALGHAARQINASDKYAGIKDTDTDKEAEEKFKTILDMKL